MAFIPDLAVQQNPSIDLGTDYIQLNANPDIVPVETALIGIFEKYKMERLGGASGGRGWSSYSTIQRCPYLYKVKYLDGYRGEPSGNLEIGSLVHTYLAIAHQKNINPDYLLTPEKVKDELLSFNANAANVLESWRIYSAYTAYYENDYIISVDSEVLAKAPNGDSCRYDGIVRIDDPSLGFPTGTFIEETKTSAIFDRAVLDGWRNDGEVIGQQMIWKAAGFNRKYGKLQGTIMNIIGKQKTPKFERIIIPIQEQQIKQHKSDLESWRALEGMYRAMGHWPRARTSCITKYGFCDLYEHCADNVPLNLGKKKKGGSK